PSLRSIRSEVDGDLDIIVAKCLEKDAKDRYPTAGALAEDLDRYLAGQTIRARSRGRMRRAWDWTTQVPIVAALVGRTTADSSPTHRRFQTGVLAALALAPILLISAAVYRQRAAAAMPRTIRIAGGLAGGMYTNASTELASKLEQRTGVACEVSATGGSWDNRQRLLEGDVALAPMQASAVSGERLRVVAPLFYEVLHVLVRDSSDAEHPIRTFNDVKGLPIAVGPSGSGSRRVAEMVLESCALNPDVCPRIVTNWPALIEEQIDAPGKEADTEESRVAMICIGPGSDLVQTMLAQSWRLVPLPNGESIALQHPTLRPMTVTPDDYSGASLDAAGVKTVGTTAFLVADASAPDALVQRTLESLYAEPLLSGQIPARRAAEWQGLAFHRAARAFFDQTSRQMPR
ncbi:MAG: TAXI family TRAP transporter solute-binding subunit, partial [Planctomycetota bacterium]